MPGRPRWRKPLLFVALAAAIVAVLGYAYASPYIALDRLKQAIDARDPQAVSDYVDFPALRESLKQQLSDELTRRIEQRNTPLAALGALIGSVLLGPLVDAYATPAGVAALMSGLPPRARPGEPPPEWAPSPASTPASAVAASPATPAPAQPPALTQPPMSTQAPASAQPPASAPGNAQARPQRSAGYRSINEFVVVYQRDTGGARYAAIFHRAGLFSWKLAAVDLRD